MYLVCLFKDLHHRNIHIMLMMQNFGSQPKSSCSVIIDAVMINCLRYLIAFSFILTAIAFWRATICLDWFGNSAIILRKACCLFGKQKEVLAIKPEAVFANGG